MRYKCLLILIVVQLLSPSYGYYHKFIAENSGTRKVRGTLNYIFNTNPNPNIADRINNNYGNDRSFSHILFVGTPKSIIERTKAANEKSLESKAKMIKKKKKQKKIDKQLKKHPTRYSKITIPDWDKDPGVSMFVASLRESSKIPVDFNIVDFNGKVVCPAKSKLKTIKLSPEEIDYIQKTYKLYYGTLGSDTIHIKYYADPKCLVSNKAQTIAIDYQTKKAKPIHVYQEMNFFKDAIMRDFDLFDEWRREQGI
jgi:hypothetical protein